MKKLSIIFLLILSFGYKGMFAQTVMIDATPSKDGTKIQVGLSVPGLQGATSVQYSVAVWGPGLTTTYDVDGKPGGSLSISTQPNCAYDISATATYQFLNATYNVAGSMVQIITNTPNPPTPGTSTSCATTFNEGFNFDQQLPDGTPITDGEIIISWGPTPPSLNTNIIFRYRVVGTNTWSYTPMIPAKGAGVEFNGQPAAWYAIGGLEPDGVEYEVQVATACSTTSVSTFGSSYTMTTLVD